MNTWLEKLLEQVEIVKDRSAKFYDKENSSAGNDTRKALQAIRKIGKEWRDEIQGIKKERRAAKSAKTA